MGEVDPVLDDCLDALIKAGPDREAGAVVWAELPTLLVSPEAARSLVDRVAVLEGLSDDDDPAARRLLECLLDEARRADEDGKAEGTDFLEAAARACAACVDGHATGDGLVALSLSYRRAGLETPEAVRQEQSRLEGEADGDAPADSDSAITDLAAALGQIVDEAGEDLLAVYNRIGESMAGMPDAACQALIHEIGRWDDDRFARLCAYWVLDPRAALAQAAADVLAERARGDRLDGDTAGRLAWLRVLLPEGALARSVEAALEAYRQRQRRWPAVVTAAGRTHAYASLVDGAGAQYLALADGGAGASRCALVLVKAGYGIRDAYVLDQLDDDDARELWETFRAAFDIYPVALATAATLIAAAIAEGQARGETPPPGLIDVAIAAGLHELRPLAVTGRAWLAHIEAAEGLDGLTPQKRGRLINRSARWPDELKAPVTWFEDNDDVRRVVLRARGEDQGRSRLRRYLDGRRDRWAELLLRSALVLDDGQQAELAASMAATAQALLDGREIRRIPVMEHMVEATLEAWFAEGEEPAPPAGEAALAPDDAPFVDFPALVAYPEDKRSVLQRLFDRGQGARVWPAGYYGVHGYLFAIATHPEPIPPSAWLQPLLGDPDGEGVAFRRKREAESVMEALGAIHDTIVDHLERDEPALPAGVKASVEANASPEPGAAVELPLSSPISHWAHGCCIAIDTFGHLEGPVRAAFGDNSELAAEVDVSHMMLRVLADPQGFSGLMMGQREDLASPGQVVAAALDGLDRYLGVLVRLANAYRDTEAEAGSESGPSRGSGGLTAEAGAGADPAPPQPARSQKVGRNEPCPCGSGRKYKRCCGNTASA